MGFLAEILMNKIIIIAALGLLYMIANEFEDESIKNRWNNHQEFLNTAQSWKNKYELTDEGELIPYETKWYHFGIEPSYEEAFPYSTTIFVFLTDGEHLFQFIKNLAILVAILIINWKLGLAWLAGSRVGSLIKELIRKIQ
jgi:hypothetical protein